VGLQEYFIRFIHSAIPCINSAKYIWFNELEKPIMIAGLKSIQDRLGEKNFPLINQYYYSNYSEMGFIPGSYPQVVKVAHMDAGMGKMKVDHEQGMKDLASVVGIHGDYSTSEPFIEGQHDLRIQKIGSKIRAFKRTGMSWKTNVDSLDIVEIELKPEYILWVNEACQLNGEYMDILTLDAVVSAEDEQKVYILEVNGCASGIPYLTEEQDKHAIACLCIQKLHQLFIKNPQESPTQKQNLEMKDLKKNCELSQLRNELEQTRIELDDMKRYYTNEMNAKKRRRSLIEYFKRNSTTRNIGITVLLLVFFIGSRYYYNY